MRHLSFAAVVLVLSTIHGAVAADQPAFVGSGKTCADIAWQPDVFKRFPNIGVVCQAIVERNGKLYAQFNGVVQRRSGHALYIRFKGGENVPGGDHAVLIDPPDDLIVQTSEGKFRVRDAQRGQDLAIFIPSDRFVVNLGDEIAPATETVVQDVVPMSELLPPPIEETPAAPAPVPQVAVAPSPQQAAPQIASEPEAPPVAASEPMKTPVAPAPVPAEKSPPWLLIAGIAIALVVVVVLAVRNRRGEPAK